MEVGFCQEERNVRYAMEQERSREKKLLSLRLNAFTILWRKTLIVGSGRAQAQFPALHGFRCDPDDLGKFALGEKVPHSLSLEQQVW